MSHPTWVCGLKPLTPYMSLPPICHTLRGCVDWNHTWGGNIETANVTPYVGVWIETLIILFILLFSCVTPYVGVWIETISCCRWLGCCGVTPYVGVWIETGVIYNSLIILLSHPTWVCGLKLLKPLYGKFPLRHTLRGCVDWNRSELFCCLWPVSHTLRGCVDWNSWSYDISWFESSHTLRGCVDWNIRCELR